MAPPTGPPQGPPQAPTAGSADGSASLATRRSAHGAADQSAGWTRRTVRATAGALRATQAPYGQPQAPYGQAAAPYGQAAGAPYGGYGAPTAPSATSNGLAVAALVLGILTYFCLGPLGAIVAIVLGFLGLRAARESGVGRGMSIAGIVLGAVGLVVGTLVIVLIVVAGSRAGTALKNLGGPADPASYQVHPGSCTVDANGETTFTGTITNETSSTKNFSVDAEFRSSSTGSIFDTSSSVVLGHPGGRHRAVADHQHRDPDRFAGRVPGVGGRQLLQLVPRPDRVRPVRSSSRAGSRTGSNVTRCGRWSALA